MIENRELTLDDYMAMLRRRWKLILWPLLAGPLLAFLLSYAFPPKYTSQSLVLVEEQKVPEGYVKPVVTEGIGPRIATLEQQVLSQNNLHAMIDRLGLTRGKSVDEWIENIRQNLSFEEVQPDIAASKQRKPGQGNDFPGFYVNFTAETPRLAQEICTELTSMVLEENLKAREQVAQSTTDFLAHQVEQAKLDLDAQDAKLATFKKRYMGQLPGEEENNLKLLAALDSQLDSYTQALNRAQQDKAYAESLLVQQLSAWKASQANENPQTLQKQLSDLQSQLVTLQARYTDDHPDVVKTRNDIAEVKRELAQIQASSSDGGEAAVKGVTEPPEIQQLRLQIHQYDQTVAQASREQKQLEDQIKTYQGRVALSPAVEEQYKELTRNYDTAQKFYNDLLAKKSESEMQTDMERRQQGEQMRLLNPASLPEWPSFPSRLTFAGGGLGVGLALGLGLTIWLEIRDKAIRTEQDVVATLELPMLVALPWVGEKMSGNGNGKSAKSATEPKRETLGV